jgi:MSHA biogenesis protein MshL
MQTLDVRSEIAAERASTVPVSEPMTTVESPLALTEDLLSLNSALTQESRIDVEVTDRPAKLFFTDLAQSQNINILVDPKINENINLSLRNVTLNQVTSALRDIYGFEFEKTNYGYRVSPNQLSTRVYRLNYLNLERSGTSKTVVGGDDTNTVTTTFAASGDASSGFWGGIETSILGFIAESDRQQDPVIINTQTGLLVIHATTKEHAKIAQFLEDAELIMQKQVIIEAKIVEVTLDHEYRSGINWTFFNNNFGSTDSSGGFGIDGDQLAGVGGVGGVFNINLSLDNFSSMLELLDYQGDVQVLSSPRVSTINNQKAVIKVGSDEYFATSSSDSSSTDDDGATATSTSIGLEKFFSGIALDVTPQIADNDYVTLHVKPTVTEVIEKTKVITINDEPTSLPLAFSNIRESDSIIRAKSGQIIVIGGLLSQKQDVGSTGLPWISKVPFLGALFSQERESQKKSELVILLKPTVYDDLTTLREVDDILERLE